MNTAFVRKKYNPHDLTHERPNFQMCNANVFHVLLHMAIYNTNSNAITCNMSDCARGHNARVHMRPINTSEQAEGQSWQSRAELVTGAEQKRTEQVTEQS